jgi:hypothetical protein
MENFFNKNVNINDTKDLPLEYVFNLPTIAKIDGVILTDNKINQRTLMNLIQYYFIFNDYFIYKDNVYKKVKNYKLSYVFVDSIENHIYKNFTKNVVSYYINNFTNYFDGFDFSYLLDNYLLKNKNILLNINDVCSSNRLSLDPTLLEFNDGIYSVTHDRFFSNKNSKNIIDLANDNNILGTLKFYNKSYS